MKLGINKKIKIIGCSTGKSSEKKTPFFALEFQNEEGEVIEGTFYLSEKNKEGKDNVKNVKKTLQTLVNAGYLRKSLTDMSDPKLKLSDLFGEPTDEINITIKDASYPHKETGEMVEKQEVQYFNVGYGGGLSKADHAESKMIFKNTKFDGFLSQLKKGDRPVIPAKPKESMQADNQDFTSDDIPF